LHMQQAGRLLSTPQTGGRKIKNIYSSDKYETLHKAIYIYLRKQQN